MDPYQNQRNTRKQLNYNRDSAHLTDNSSPGVSGDQNPDRDDPDGGNPAQTDRQPATDRQPRYSDGFTMIAPNQSRRSKLTTTAQKELEAYERWREANRPSSVHVNPEKLGGDVTLAEARQKQLTDFRCSKLQKKLKKEELDKKRRQEEEEALQRMKAERRETAERQVERRRQEEQRRSEQLEQDHLRTTESFLQSLERRAPAPLASGSATRTSSRSEAVPSKQRESKSEIEVQQEHKRVNAAFLDRLEGRSRGSDTETRREGIPEAQCSRFVSEDFRQQPSNVTAQQLPSAHLDPDPEQSCSGWTEDADSDPDYDWALMKLINSFPDCSRVFLEDILDQCEGDYEQAYTLLISTLT